MHVGNQPSGASEDRAHAAADATPPSVPSGIATGVPASGGALVPALAIICHVAALWWAPLRPGTLKPWLPWPIEALLVWLPWTSVCLWAALATPNLPPSRRLRDALIAGAAWLCSLHYVLRFRLPSALQDWSPERHLSELAGFFSATWQGAPWTALLYAMGWTACATLTARVARETVARLPFDAGTSRRVAGLCALLVFLIGSSALLRYATGSPWPLLGTL